MTPGPHRPRRARHTSPLLPGPVVETVRGHGWVALTDLACLHAHRFGGHLHLVGPLGLGCPYGRRPGESRCEAFGLYLPFPQHAVALVVTATIAESHAMLADEVTSTAAALLWLGVRVPPELLRRAA